MCGHSKQLGMPTRQPRSSMTVGDIIRRRVRVFLQIIERAKEKEPSR
jgi:hypothetical protein